MGGDFIMMHQAYCTKQLGQDKKNRMETSLHSHFLSGELGVRGEKVEGMYYTSFQPASALPFLQSINVTINWPACKA